MIPGAGSTILIMGYMLVCSNPESTQSRARYTTCDPNSDFTRSERTAQECGGCLTLVHRWPNQMIPGAGSTILIMGYLLVCSNPGSTQSRARYTTCDPNSDLGSNGGGGGKMDGRLELCHKEVKSDGTTCRAKQWDHGLPAGMLKS